MINLSMYLCILPVGLSVYCACTDGEINQNERLRLGITRANVQHTAIPIHALPTQCLFYYGQITTASNLSMRFAASARESRRENG